MTSDVVALCVDPRGHYPRLVRDWYDETRDARTYDGDRPVVAHPPCSRWCQLAGLVEAVYGHKRGEDGGLFAAMLATVRRVGGVLEHPAYSLAWERYDLPRPPPDGGWVRSLTDPGWVCQIDQARYGHRARKSTWLYAVGIDPPPMRWGRARGSALVSWAANHIYHDDRPRLSKREASESPIEFARLLVAIAATAAPTPSAGPVSNK